MTCELILTQYRIKNESGNMFYFDNDRVSFDSQGVIIKWELFSDYLDSYFEIPILVIEKKKRSKLETVREKIAEYLSRIADVAG